ncbi:hypothetical protein EA_SCOWL_1 [Mycobacterium phage Scowl]|nr:hypothetical protein EA_SCOWL_1 [Mycobacterium phage Scowl]AVP41762.1 hypothetical protein PBI_GAGEAP_1 [Mycobacterium phage GageAP]
MKCCYITDLESGETCGEPEAESFMRVPVCVVHKDELRRSVDGRGRGNALTAAKYHPLESFPGFCYVVLLPDGFVKIGYSNTENLLHQRLKALSRSYEAPVIPLKILPGGFVTEAVLHNRFKSDRLPGPGERFRYSPAMAEFLAEQQAAA